MENKAIKILHLEDLPDDAELIAKTLKNSKVHCKIMWVNNRIDYVRELKKFMPDIILADHTLPAFNSLEALAILGYSGNEIPFILVSGTTSEEYVVRLMKEGMDDYILKDQLQRLPDAVLNTLENFHLKIEKKKANDEIIANESMMKIAEHLAHLGSWETDLIAGITKWSDEMFRIYGYTPGEVNPDYEKSISHVHPEDLSVVKKTVEEVIAVNDSYKSEFRIIDKSGKVKYLRAEVIVKYSSNLKPVRINGFNLDITSEREKV